MDGLQRLLDFLARLQEKNITYSIHHYAPDSITVYFTLIGARVEAAFDPREMTFSMFKGPETVEGDPTLLERLIREHWSD